MSTFKVGVWPNTQFEHVVFTGSSAQSYTLGNAHQTPGLRVVLKNEGTGVVTINTANSQMIDGASSAQLGTQYSQMVLFSDGANWAVENYRAAPPAYVTATAQTASIASTALFTAGEAGLYRATVDLITTTAGSAGTVTASVVNNNGVASNTQTTATCSLTVAGTEVSTEFTFYSAANQAVNYLTTVASAAGSPAYAVRVRVDFLG